MNQKTRIGFMRAGILCPRMSDAPGLLAAIADSHAFRLSLEWREKAKEFRRFGADDQAVTLDYCADDLEETWRIWQTEPLLLEEAAKESGFSYSSLQKRVSDGEIPNIGKPGQPRVRRQDLPRKTPRQRFGTCQRQWDTLRD